MLTRDLFYIYTERLKHPDIKSKIILLSFFTRAVEILPYQKYTLNVQFIIHVLRRQIVLKVSNFLSRYDLFKFSECIFNFEKLCKSFSYTALSNFCR